MKPNRLSSALFLVAAVHYDAHEICYITNSIKSQVVVKTRD